MSGVIDASAFPHIIDMIFAAAPRASLIALRGACSDWRRRVDTHMAVHVTFKVADHPHGPFGIVLLSGPRRVPAFAPVGTNDLDEDTPDRWKAEKARGRIANVRVADVDDEDIHPAVDRIARHMPCVRTVRMLGAYEGVPRGTKARDLGPCVDRWVQFISAGPEKHWNRRQVTVDINLVPNGVRRTIVNIALDIRDGSGIHFQGCDALPTSLRELVLVFHPLQGPTPRPPGRYVWPSHTLDAFHHVARLIVEHADRVKFTLVGVLEMHKRNFGLDADDDGNYDEDTPLEDTLTDAMRYIASNTCMFRGEKLERTRAALDDIQWISLDDYKAQTPKEKWEIECVRPWSLPEPPRKDRFDAEY